MGGSIVLRMLVDKRITINNAICDGGITPYQMPWLLTRFTAVKDFLLISMGKIGGLGLLEKAFATDEYSKEDLKYMAKIFRFISYKTIWRTFESCNNYRMPEDTIKYPGKVRSYNKIPTYLTHKQFNNKFTQHFSQKVKVLYFYIEHLAEAS